MTIKYRGYQSLSIEMPFEYMAKNPGNPCLKLPTGAGKSIVVAGICKKVMNTWPDSKIIMLTHQKELIEQNAEKMRLIWPGAPMGIYSASVGKRNLGEPITFAGIQSIVNKKELLGKIDLIIVDECDLINNKQQGSYRKLIDHLKSQNEHMRVIGLTATPYRLGQGLITDGDEPIFNDILEPITIHELIEQGYLAPLRSKLTDTKMDFSGVAVRGGDYSEKEKNEAAVKCDNEIIVDEAIHLAGDRKAWLFFCSGVDHAEIIKDILILKGIEAEIVTGKTPKKERERILSEYKAGKIRALTNANVLTTGFDYPDIDMIAFLSPTLSARKYVQMAGRGMRLKSHTDHCLVLDFAGLIQKHGPVTDVTKPQRSKKGEAPIKICEQCNEITHLSAQFCPCCGYQFFELDATRQRMELDKNSCIMGLDKIKEKKISSWVWKEHTGAKSGNAMIKVTYYEGLNCRGVTEYFPVLNNSEVGSKAVQTIYNIASKSGANINCENLHDLCIALNISRPPTSIKFEHKGRLSTVYSRIWNHGQENTSNRMAG